MDCSLPSGRSSHLDTRGLQSGWQRQQWPHIGASPKESLSVVYVFRVRQYLSGTVHGSHDIVLVEIPLDHHCYELNSDTFSLKGEMAYADLLRTDFYC